MMTQRKTSRTSKKPVRSAVKTAKAAPKSRVKTVTKTKRPQARRPLLHPIHLSVTALLLLAIGAAFLFASLGKGVTSDAATCTVTDKLVNTCRPWFSAAVGGYNTGGKSQFQFFNARLNNPNVLNNTGTSVNLTYKLDVPHVYHAPGQNLFSSGVKDTLNDSSLYGHASKPILVNWKPGGSSWGSTANGASDASIRTAAQNVKALGSRKIMLALWHEPENDNVNATGVSITGNCKKPTGSNGSAAEYRKMWQRVYDVFKQEGVSNVVWVWNPMGWVGNDGKTGWACIENDMYPGDHIVDWIMWDPYSSDHGDFDGSVEDFYKFLTANSMASGKNKHGLSQNYLSKPWGLAEHGSNSDPAKAIGYWQEGVRVIGRNWSQNKFPNIKLYSVFDTSSNGGVNGGLRVGYNNLGQIDAAEQATFNEFAKNILTFGDGTSSGGGTPTPIPNPNPTPPSGKDTAPPTVSITAPADNTRQRGTITIKGSATDNVKVTAVTLRADNKWIATEKEAPYEFRLDTRKLGEGKHSIVLRSWDKAGNMGQSKTVVITVDNNNSTRDDGTTAPSTGSTVVSPSTPSSTAKPIPVVGTVIISPTATGSSIQVWVGNKLMSNNIVDSVNLTDGKHTIKISENGVISFKTISVDNPTPIAAVNHVRANAVAYAVSVAVFAAVGVVWFGRSYIVGLTSRREASLVKSQRNYRK